MGTTRPARPSHGRRRRDLEGFTHDLVRVFEHATAADAIAARTGLLQSLDARIKLMGVLALIISTVLVTRLSGVGVLFGVTLFLALVSRVRLTRLAQIWLGVMFFTGVIAVPALILTPGQALAHLPIVHWPITETGLRGAAFLIGRAEVCSTLVLLLILTTPWPHVLKALRALGVPMVAVAILSMTHRYIFLLLQSAMQMFEARRSRTLGPMTRAARRRAIVSGAGTLLSKTFQLSTEVHLAMVARGYRGEVHVLDDFQTRTRDWLFLVSVLVVPALVAGL